MPSESSLINLAVVPDCETISLISTFDPWTLVRWLAGIIGAGYCCWRKNPTYGAPWGLSCRPLAWLFPLPTWLTLLECQFSLTRASSPSFCRTYVWSILFSSLRYCTSALRAPTSASCSSVICPIICRRSSALNPLSSFVTTAELIWFGSSTAGSWSSWEVSYSCGVISARFELSTS